MASSLHFREKQQFFPPVFARALSFLRKRLPLALTPRASRKEKNQTTVFLLCSVLKAFPDWLTELKPG